MQSKADPRPTVLLTGFGPFPGVPDNASAAIVERVAAEAACAFPHQRFVWTVLPSEWRRAPQRVAMFHTRLRPILALHIGVASQQPNIRLETRAQNVCRESADAAGLPPMAPMVCEDGPPQRAVSIDIPLIARKLEGLAIAHEISGDAGSYLCNAVLYQSLASCEDRGSGTAGFVHIPRDPLDVQRYNEVITAMTAILGVCLAQ
jgi:pyroglutamyl-peptidase